MNAQPYIVTLSCPCFFRGRDFIISPECTEHAEDEPDEKTEFSFDELSERAKQQARSNYRNRDYPHDEWWDSTYDDANKIAEMLGIIVDTHPVTLYGGGTRLDLSIWFSGFFSQGDGACLEGDWRPTKDPLAALNKVMEHAPQDTRLHEIAFDLVHLSERCNALIPDAYVRVTQSGHYSNSMCTNFEVDLPTPDHVDYENELQMMTWNALVTHHGLEFYAFEAEIKDCLRAFMNWIYRKLEAEHDYLTSDEVIDEALADYNFDEDGEML